MSAEAIGGWTGPKLHLMLVDSELEMVPKELWSHPSIALNARRRGKKPSQLLLDSNLHHSAFRDREESSRRGRPDMVHQFLLLGLDSILNLEGGLGLYVHTRNDELVLVDPSTRLPKNMNRYMGLFEELFASKVVPSREMPLLELKGGMTLERSIDLVRNGARKEGRGLHVVLFTPGGELKRANQLFRGLLVDGNKGYDVLSLIGGFPHGDFRSDASGNSDLRISLSERLLKVWTVEMEVLVGFREAVIDR